MDPITEVRSHEGPASIQMVLPHLMPLWPCPSSCSSSTQSDSLYYIFFSQPSVTLLLWVRVVDFDLKNQV